jgi:hypothetical protein
MVLFQRIARHYKKIAGVMNKPVKLKPGKAQPENFALP